MIDISIVEKKHFDNLESKLLPGNANPSFFADVFVDPIILIIDGFKIWQFFNLIEKILLNIVSLKL